MARHRVFLIPGFFGFSNLGELFYFQHLVDHLTMRFQSMGHEIDIVRVRTHPTASLKKRAGRLLDAMREAPEDGADLHLIGHSSGGLDARIILAPRPDVSAGFDVGSVTERVKTLLTVSTPHHGAPLAGFFSTRFGAPALWTLSVITLFLLKFEKTPPVRAFVKLGSMMTRVDDIVGGDNSIVDQVFRELLDDFSDERQKAVTELFNDVRSDRTLVHELSVDNMRAFKPELREGVRAASVVTRARQPSLTGTVEAGLNPYAQASRALYGQLHQRAGFGFEEHDVEASLHAQVVAMYGEEPPASANDGIVPTWSQPFGEVIAAPWADHLDVIGHFKDRTHVPPHIDWLVTGSGFNRSRFEAVWDTAVEWMLKNR